MLLRQSLAAACLLAPSAYTVLALAGAVPMTTPIYLAWLGWLQAAHVIVGIAVWRRRDELSTKMKAALISWGGLAFWYWCPAAVYFLLTMNLDSLQLTWTALAFFWEVPVGGGAFVWLAQWLYPTRRAIGDPVRRYRAVVRYPTLVAALLFVFTLAGYVVGALQLRWFAALPLIEQAKNVAHGLVISLLLAVFYQLALDRVLAPVRARVAADAGIGAIVTRTVAARIFGVSLAVALSGFALVSLFVLQAFQNMARDAAVERMERDLALAAAAPPATTLERLRGPGGWGARATLTLLRDGDTLPAAEFGSETRRFAASTAKGFVHDSRQDLKLVGIVPAPALGGRLVGVTYLTDGYGPIVRAATLLTVGGGCVLVVIVGMLVFASRASTQAVRSLSTAVRRVEAGEASEATLRIDTGDEIGELSVAIERYARQSRDLRENLEEKVRDKTRELSDKLEQIERADLALAREQRRLHAIVEHLPEGVLLLGPGGAIALANPLARRYVGSLIETSADGHVVAVGGIPLARLLFSPDGITHEISTGELRRSAYQVAARHLDDPQEGQACVLVIRDVTLEREAQHSAQQQARLAAVGQLAAGIAHDFNNILMTVINSAELARRRHDDTPFVASRLETIQDQGQRAAALVRQILDFSRQSTPSLRPTDLGALVRQTIALLERTLPETIKIAVDVAPGRLGVAADANQLSQVITNLAVNARDAMPLGGELRFSVGLHSVAAAAADAVPGTGTWVVVAVTDTGTGMSPEIAERIFEPFFTTKAPGRGTGLGLSQAYGIVQQHRGHITIASQIGRGTTVTIYLPALTTAASVVADERPTGLPHGNGETLLLVEDEPRVRQALAEMLGELNYRVLTAGSAEEAIDLHTRHADEVELVLTDLVMPGAGGRGLLQAIRDRKPGVPIVMMTGYERGALPRELEGVAAWVQKPATPRTLGAVLRDALASTD